VVCVCCKATSDAYHNVALLDAAHGSVQHAASSQPQSLYKLDPHQSHILQHITSSECDATAHDIITTPTEAIKGGVARSYRP